MTSTKTIPQENMILFDWVTFTSKIDSPESIKELLGLSEITWQVMEKGRNGYRQRWMFENISICFDGNDNMGVCVDISGTGCRAFETYSTSSWEDLFHTLHYYPEDYNISRLDMAFDDHTGILDIDVIRDDYDDHHFVSKCHVWNCQYGSKGTSVYHGSEKSNMYIRIYDKAAEQANKHKDPTSYGDVHWIRVEMQMRDEIASGFVDGLMIHPVGDQFRGVLHNYLRYVVPQNDTNMSRWPMTAYWAELLDGVQRIRCWSCSGVDYDEFRLSNYIINQAGNALDCYLYIFGEEDLKRELGNRAIRKSPKYERLKQKYDNLKRGRSDA